jgi:hypothetical protein
MYEIRRHQVYRVERQRRRSLIAKLRRTLRQRFGRG